MAIVNQSFAERFFAGEDVIGRQLRCGDSESEEPWRTIVGVAPDLYMEGLTGRSERHPRGIYVPVAQQGPRFISIATRGQVPPQQLASIIREEIAVLHADTPIYWVRTMSRALREEIWWVDHQCGFNFRSHA